MSNNMQHYENIIVGGGIAGLICAAYLARGKQKTLLLEKNSSVGGRAESFELPGGFKANLHGPSWHISWANGFWPQAARDFGLNIKYTTNNDPRTYLLGTGQYLKGSGMKFYTAEALVDFVRLRSGKELTPAQEEDYLKIFKDMLSYTWKDLGIGLDTVRLSEWLSERTEDAEIKGFFYSVIGGLMMTQPSDVERMVSAGKSIDQFRAWIVGENASMFPQPTTHEALIRPLAEKIEALGGEIRTAHEVQEVLIEDGKAVGVRVQGPAGEEIIHADRVIVNAVYKDVPKLFKELPEEIMNIIADLGTTEYADLFLVTGLKEAPPTANRYFNMIVDSKTGAFVCHMAFQSLINPQNHYAPDGKETCYVQKIYTVEELKKTTLQEKIEYLNDIQEEVAPGFKERIEIQQPYVHCPLWHHQYSAFKKLPQKPSFAENLYFIGDSTEMNIGYSVDGVAASGMYCAEDILGTPIKKWL